MTTLHHISKRGQRLAYRSHPCTSGKITFVWLSGFKSDMSGTKVMQLESWAKAEGHGFLAFDYSGHGLSEGRFEEGTVSDWRSDAIEMIETATTGPLILVGSSMGGWMALLAMLALKPRVAGMVLIAPAPDFTQKLMWPEFSAQQQAEIMDTGQTLRPSDYGDPYPITRALIEDGAQWQILDAPIAFGGPVRILQGMLDDAVPWTHAQRLIDTLTTTDLVFTLIKDGDHRLSRDQDIRRLIETCDEIAETTTASG